MDGSVSAGGGLSPSVSATLDVLAAEIELAGARCIHLDQILGQVLDGLPAAERARLVAGMHGVDLLAQHLTSLSAFARTMSLAAPDEMKLSVDTALSEITLGALAERMRAGLGGADDGDADGQDAGDLDLF